MDRIKISVPMGGRVITLDINGPIVTPEIVNLKTAEAILREGHKVYYYKTDGTSEELTLPALYVLMEAEQMIPTMSLLAGEAKDKSVLTRLGVNYETRLYLNGSFGGREGLAKILSTVGTVKSVDSVSGVDNMLDTLADWWFSRARLNSDEGITPQPQRMLVVISNLFNMELTAFDIVETFSEGGWLPEALVTAGANPETYGITACFRFAQKSYDYEGWNASPLELDRLYAENHDKIYIIGNTDEIFARGALLELSTNPLYDITVIGAEDDNIANWVADSGLNPETYEADPYIGSTIVFPPKWNT